MRSLDFEGAVASQPDAAASAGAATSAESGAEPQRTGAEVETASGPESQTQGLEGPRSHPSVLVEDAAVQVSSSVVGNSAKQAIISRTKALCQVQRAPGGVTYMRLKQKLEAEFDPESLRECKSDIHAVLEAHEHEVLTTERRRSPGEST